MAKYSLSAAATICDAAERAIFGNPLCCHIGGEGNFRDNER